MNYPYMIGKKKWGVYAKTMQYSAGIFASGDPGSMAMNSGTHYHSDRSLFLVKSFGQELTVSYPEGNICFRDTSHSPLFSLCLPLINYLVRADGTELSGGLISYRELENGHVFYPAFRRGAINKLSAWVEGKTPDLLAAAVKDLGGEITGGADLGCKLYIFPRFPVILKLWFPDEETGGSANILFDSTANHYLHTEDIAAIGELAAYFLMSHYEFLHENK